MTDDPLWDSIDPHGLGPLHFNRAGEPITLRRWVELQTTYEYKVVAKTLIGDEEVSTVWLGLDHGFGGGVPLIFETMVFSTELSISPLIGEYYEPLHDLQRRYSTEAEALHGHAEIVGVLSARAPDVIPEEIREAPKGTGRERPSDG